MTGVLYCFAVVFAVALAVIIGERLPFEGMILLAGLVCFASGVSFSSAVWLILSRRRQQTPPEPPDLPMVMWVSARQELSPRYEVHRLEDGYERT